MEKKPQAISFDVVGTFLHFSEPVAETYERFGREYGLRPSAATLRKRIDLAFQAAPGLVAPKNEDAGTFEREWWLQLAGRIFGCASDDVDFMRCFDTLFSWYAGADAWRMNPEFPGFLLRLKETGVKLAIVSNFDARLYGLLEAFSLSGLFDAVVLPRHAGFQKPQPGMFRFASVQLGIPPSGTALYPQITLQRVVRQLYARRALAAMVVPLPSAATQVWPVWKHSLRASRSSTICCVPLSCNGTTIAARVRLAYD